MLLVLQANSQDFVNGGLEGIVNGVNSMPPGWQTVPYTDPICDALTWSGATPDLIDANGPEASHGLNGNPYEGQTFIAGLRSGSHHEGFRQLVTGLTPNNTYTIRFHQTVLKNVNSDVLDSSGAWSVYAGSTLLGTTASTFSAEEPGSLNLPWELREIVFVAPSDIVTIKFMPTDDDGNWKDANGVRMGIDAISLIADNTVGMNEATIEETLILPTVLTPDHVGAFVTSQNVRVSSLHATIFDLNGMAVFTTNDPWINWDGRNASGAEHPAGMYYYRIVAVSNTGLPLLKSGRVLLVR